MESENWHYATAKGRELSFIERLKQYPREPDALVHAARITAAVMIRAGLRGYNRFDIVGRKNLPRNGSFVLVANHASHMDAVALLSALPLQTLHNAYPLAARDYFGANRLRFVMSAIIANVMLLDRDAAGCQSLKFCRQMLGEPGNVFIMFPEGTRSTDGRIGLFKRGIGLLVAGTTYPVVPCYLDGTSGAWPKGACMIRPARVRLIIGEARTYEQVEQNDAGALRICAELRTAVLALASEIRLHTTHFTGILLMINIQTHSATIFDSTPTEHSMTLTDGTEIFYHAWIPLQPTRKTLVIFHRGHEHSGRLEDVVRDLGLNDVAVFAWDARGHGRSSGARGYAPTFGCLAKDVDDFVHHICETYGKRIEDMVVFGHSVGAVTVAAWVHDYAPLVRAMILVTPALRIKLYVPFARQGLRLLRWLLPGKSFYVSSYVKGRLLTHDPAEARHYDTDPVISRTIAVNVLLGLHDTSTRLIADAAAIRTPALVLAGGADWVVKLSAQRRFFERLGSEEKRLRIFDGMYHDILHEKDRHLVIDEIRNFVRNAFARDETPSDNLEAIHTHDEYEQLRRPLQGFSLRRLWFTAQRAFMKTTGRLSNGIRIGWRDGFDSGNSLDYIYENQARGKLLLGRIIDWFYLNNPAWVGIRQRKMNVEKLLQQAIMQISETGAPVRILDVATGQGRYVLETLASIDVPDVTAVLRDNTPANLEAGRQQAARFGLKNVTFEHADAFDVASYRLLDPRPNIAIISGLFELFPDNQPVQQCLKGIAAAIEDGGYLIYTGQPWHPQIEMIARVLKNRNDEPWVMRRRTQRELDDLVRQAGFEKIGTKVGGRGIFTVSIAQRCRNLQESNRTDL